MYYISFRNFGDILTLWAYKFYIYMFSILPSEMREFDIEVLCQPELK